MRSRQSELLKSGENKNENGENVILEKIEVMIE